MPFDFGEVAFWDEEYASGRFSESYDWVATWDDLALEVQKVAPKRDARVLVPGCGNAPFQLNMYRAGYTNLVCGDNSETVIQQMRTSTCSLDPAIQWDIMDATSMPYVDSGFDLVIDKSLVDCLQCCDEPITILRRYIDEVFRVLRPGGSFMLISFQSIQELRASLQGRSWVITRLEDFGSPRRGCGTDICEASALDSQPDDAGNIRRVLAVCRKNTPSTLSEPSHRSKKKVTRRSRRRDADDEIAPGELDFVDLDRAITVGDVELDEDTIALPVPTRRSIKQQQKKSKKIESRMAQAFEACDE